MMRRTAMSGITLWAAFEKEGWGGFAQTHDEGRKGSAQTFSWGRRAPGDRDVVDGVVAHTDLLRCLLEKALAVGPELHRRLRLSRHREGSRGAVKMARVKMPGKRLQAFAPQPSMLRCRSSPGQSLAGSVDDDDDRGSRRPWQTAAHRMASM